MTDRPATDSGAVDRSDPDRLLEGRPTDGGRCDHLRLDDSVVVFDPERADAWLQSDAAVTLPLEGGVARSADGDGDPGSGAGRERGRDR